MLLNPGILAILWCSALVGAITTVALIAGLSAAVAWNPDDGGERQLARERRNFLVETAVKLVLGGQMASLFLFVAVADRIHPLLTGAMCAAGTFNANPNGYPALGVKLVVFLLCGLWLVLDRASPVAVSVGLVRLKHLLLLMLWGGLVAENLIQWRFFSELEPELITSCCATIFDQGGGAAAGLAAVPVGASRAAFGVLLALTVATGAYVVGRRRSPVTFAVLAASLGAVSAAAIVSWVAPTFYQLPTHHCPFCLLSAGVGRVGYALYALLALAVVCGVGAGLIRGARSLDPLASIRPGEEHRMCLVSTLGFVAFAVIAVWPSLWSDFRMGAS